VNPGISLAISPHGEEEYACLIRVSVLSSSAETNRLPRLVQGGTEEEKWQQASMKIELSSPKSTARTF
jgi:hypothetical protein